MQNINNSKAGSSDALPTQAGDTTSFAPASELPLINILIRTHRPHLLCVCLDSVADCRYCNVKVITIDGTGYGERYGFNLLCNDLQNMVEDGYYFFLDDDDTLIPGALSQIAPHLTPDKPVICQMLRAGRPKPSINVIARGHIGLPCMILHHSHKHLADVTARESGDYDWIKAVTDKLGYKWVPVPLVNSPKRSFGK